MQQTRDVPAEVMMPCACGYPLGCCQRRWGLSEGEWQRLMLARFLVRADVAKLLVLDEPFKCIGSGDAWRTLTALAAQARGSGQVRRAMSRISAELFEAYPLDTRRWRLLRRPRLDRHLIHRSTERIPLKPAPSKGQGARGPDGQALARDPYPLTPIVFVCSGAFGNEPGPVAGAVGRHGDIPGAWQRGRVGIVERVSGTRGCLRDGPERAEHVLNRRIPTYKAVDETASLVSHAGSVSRVGYGGFPRLGCTKSVGSGSHSGGSGVRGGDHGLPGEAGRVPRGHEGSQGGIKRRRRRPLVEPKHWCQLLVRSRQRV